MISDPVLSIPAALLLINSLKAYFICLMLDSSGNLLLLFSNCEVVNKFVLSVFGQS